MKRSCRGLLIAVALVGAIASIAVAGDLKEEAIEKDRKQIEGTWKVVAAILYGSKVPEAEAQKLSVVNGSDGAWSIRSEGKEIGKGTSAIDPTAEPKTIDFTPTEGDAKGLKYLGIYELDENTRRLCFSRPGKERPTEFTSAPGSQDILVTFQRVTVK